MDSLIIGIGGHAVRLEPSGGQEVWRTHLKGRDTVTLHRQGDQLFAGTGGELFRLDESTGRILWQNKLKGLGLGLVCFEQDDLAAGDRLQRTRRAHAAAGA